MAVTAGKQRASARGSAWREAAPAKSALQHACGGILAPFYALGVGPCDGGIRGGVDTRFIEVRCMVN